MRRRTDRQVAGSPASDSPAGLQCRRRSARRADLPQAPHHGPGGNPSESEALGWPGDRAASAPTSDLPQAPRRNETQAPRGYRDRRFWHRRDQAPSPDHWQPDSESEATGSDREARPSESADRHGHSDS